MTNTPSSCSLHSSQIQLLQSPQIPYYSNLHAIICVKIHFLLPAHLENIHSSFRIQLESLLHRAVLATNTAPCRSAVSSMTQESLASTLIPLCCDCLSADEVRCSRSWAETMPHRVSELKLAGNFLKRYRLTWYNKRHQSTMFKLGGKKTQNHTCCIFQHQHQQDAHTRRRAQLLMTTEFLVKYWDLSGTRLRGYSSEENKTESPHSSLMGDLYEDTCSLSGIAHST